MAKSAVTRPIKRSFSIGGHRTSISLEADFWSALKEVAARERLPLAKLVATIDQSRGEAGLSSAVRIWLLKYFQDRAPNSKA
ncbi:MAG: aryl-sulfate sulfotransferase [Hyphomicrobium sp. SCN 65-11]|nr:MAG: aryl-sulfate sulfotransferase [Hyphomicrobium sp. SCN 65-11]